MTVQNSYEGIKQVVLVTSDDNKNCQLCSNFHIGPNNFEESINHYITDHNYKLLHVGQQTSNDMNGNPWQLTVAVHGQ
ncbi:MAG: hypothetical protein U9R02_12060 [Thermodesulfobacteriota bacterium]|nr:hypothetical protein [Thermodesulfobacteriota bacterium]